MRGGWEELASEKDERAVAGLEHEVVAQGWEDNGMSVTLGPKSQDAPSDTGVWSGIWSSIAPPLYACAVVVVATLFGVLVFWMVFHLWDRLRLSKDNNSTFLIGGTSGTSGTSGG